VQDTNVLAVKAIMDIATAMIKIHARLDLPVHLAQLVPMENTAPMAEKAKLDHLVPAKDTRIHQDLADVSNVLPVPKDLTDLLDPLDQLAKKAVPAAKPEMANPAAPAQLDPQVTLARLAVMANLVPKANLARMRKLAAKDPLDPKEKKAGLDQLEEMAMQEQQAKPAHLAHLVHKEVLAKVAKMEEKETLDHPAHLEDPVQTPNTALALIVPRRRRLKESQHRINPNTILEQDGFDNDYQSFQNTLKLDLIASIIIFICSWCSVTQLA